MMSSNAAQDASAAQAAATNRGIDAQQAAQMRAEALQREAMGKLDPFMTTGKSALASLAQLYGLTPPDGGAAGTPFGGDSMEAFKRSPDYEFARSEGMNALALNKSASGMLHSGNYLRDLTQFGSGLATQNFGNYAGRLMSLSQLGANAAGMGANAAIAGGGQAIQSGNSLAQLQLAGGQAEASGIVGSANAITGGMNSLTNNLMLYNMMNKGGSFGGGGGGGNIGYGTGANGWVGNTGKSGWIEPSNSLSYYNPGPTASFGY